MHSSNNTLHTGKRINRRLTQEQVQLLEASFKLNPKLDPERKYHLAQQLGLPVRQVAVWYQNKRARWRSQTLEMDHRVLQQRLDDAMVDNEGLQRQVQRLRQELEGARQQLLLMSSSSSLIMPNKYPSGCKYSSEEEGNSAMLGGEPNSSVPTDLFAYLTGNNGGQL